MILRSIDRPRRQYIGHSAASIFASIYTLILDRTVESAEARHVFFPFPVRLSWFSLTLDEMSSKYQVIQLSTQLI